MSIKFQVVFCKPILCVWCTCHSSFFFFFLVPLLVLVWSFEIIHSVEQFCNDNIHPFMRTHIVHTQHDHHFYSSSLLLLIRWARVCSTIGLSSFAHSNTITRNTAISFGCDALSNTTTIKYQQIKMGEWQWAEMGDAEETERFAFFFVHNWTCLIIILDAHDDKMTIVMRCIAPLFFHSIQVKQILCKQICFISTIFTIHASTHPIPSSLSGCEHTSHIESVAYFFVFSVCNVSFFRFQFSWIISLSWR